MDAKKEFGTAVKVRRTYLGLSQKALAERSDMHRTYVTDIERGMRNLTLENISKLAGGLGLTIGELFPHGDHTKDAGINGSNGSGPSQPPRFKEKGLLDILLVEDDTADIELAIAAFKQARLMNRIHVLRDGAAALDFIFGLGDQRPRLAANLPGAVLLDLNLPLVSGLEVLRRIKADPATRDVKVVVLTASKKHEDLREAMRLGAASYIVKPVNFQSFSEITPTLNLWWTLLESNARPGIHAR